MKREETAKLTKRQKCGQLWSDFRSFLYSKQGDEPAVVMGRTALSWGKIGLFFFVYYSCLAAFFAAIFAIAFSTMPDTKDGPKYTSLISDKPLLLVYPSAVSGYSTTNKSLADIRERYENFLYGYRDTQCYTQKKCVAGDGYHSEDEDKQCGFDLNSLGECAPNSTSSFGYRDNAPCLYLRLSKIYDWKPKPGKDGKYIQLDCDAEDNDDAKITYHPPREKAFPISFWPFRGQTAWRAPIAAIQVSASAGVTIRCRAIADNIELSDTYKLNRGAHGQLEFTVAGPPKSS